MTGRFLGRADNPSSIIGERITRAAIAAPFNTIFSDQAATGGIDPLLVSLIAKEAASNLSFREPRSSSHEQKDVGRNGHTREHSSKSATAVFKFGH
jgi:hypothetical protein